MGEWGTIRSTVSDCQATAAQNKVGCSIGGPRQNVIVERFLSLSTDQEEGVQHIGDGVKHLAFKSEP